MGAGLQAVILKRRLVNLKGETQGKKKFFRKQGSKGIYSRWKVKEERCESGTEIHELVSDNDL